MTSIENKLIDLEAKRKEAEENLKKSEEKYKHLFEHAPFCIVLTNLEGVILDINLATKKLFGYKKEDLVGKNYLNLTVYPSRFKEILKLRLLKLMEGKPVKPAEFQIYKKNGDKTWIQSTISSLNLGNETVLQAFILDINNQKNFKQTIKRKLEIEKTISMISSRFVGNVNIDSAIIDSLKDLGILSGASRAYIMLYNEDDTVKPYIYEWCANNIEIQKESSESISVAKFPWSLKQYRENGLIYIENVSNLPPEAETTRLELNSRGIDSILIFPIIIKEQLYGFISFDNIIDTKEWKDEDFALIRTSSEIIGSALERKWAEETLKGSHQLLAGIISSLTESICLIDNDYNIIWVNNVVKNTFGSNLTSMKCYEAFFCRDRRCKSCIAEKTFSNGKIHEYEANIISEGKENKYWCTSSTAALNFDGQTELIVLIFRDITK